MLRSCIVPLPSPQLLHITPLAVYGGLMLPGCRMPAPQSFLTPIPGAPPRSPLLPLPLLGRRPCPLSGTPLCTSFMATLSASHPAVDPAPGSVPSYMCLQRPSPTTHPTRCLTTSGTSVHLILRWRTTCSSLSLSPHSYLPLPSRRHGRQLSSLLASPPHLFPPWVARHNVIGLMLDGPQHYPPSGLMALQNYSHPNLPS